MNNALPRRGFWLLVLLTVAGCSGGEPGRPADAVVQGVHYVGLVVSDLEQSTAFYGAAGLESLADRELHSDAFLDRQTGRESVQIQTRLLRSVNAQLRLMQFESPGSDALASEPLAVYGPGIAHVCYQVAKDTQTYQKFLAAGAQTIGAADLVHLNPRNPVYYGYARDPDGATFEVEHVDVAQLALPEPPANTHRIRHVSLATGDMNRLVAFYSTLLQEANPRRVGRWWSLKGESLDAVSGLKDSAIEMAWFQVRNLELEIIQYHSHSPATSEQPRPLDAPGYNMIVFDVPSLAAARERLTAAGAMIEADSVSLDDAEILFARDPDGNLLGFQVLSEASPFSSQNFANNGT